MDLNTVEGIATWLLSKKIPFKYQVNILEVPHNGKVPAFEVIMLPSKRLRLYENGCEISLDHLKEALNNY